MCTCQNYQLVKDTKCYFFMLKVHEAIRREQKARMEARNYGKVLVSNNESK